MVRFFAGLVGIGFIGALLWAILTTPLTMEVNAIEEFHEEPRALHLASDGPLGRFDNQQLQRGMQVFKEVCAACHALNQVSFRDFAALGYNEDEIKALAASWPIQTPSINPDTGEAASRPSVASDHLPTPYPNEVAARAANNNAYPPDLSLITKAREGKEAYVYSLLTGYRNVPANLPAALRPSGTLHYNPWFANLNIAMPPPLTAEGQVTYADGTKATVDQMAQDVSAFLVWSAEPKLAMRHQVGWAVLGFLLIFSILCYLSYRSIWAEKKGH
jgi:ubiquinol-cytochrome c reductase cytochrome c1 subunit